MTQGRMCDQCEQLIRYDGLFNEVRVMSCGSDTTFHQVKSMTAVFGASFRTFNARQDMYNFVRVPRYM